MSPLLLLSVLFISCTSIKYRKCHGARLNKPCFIPCGIKSHCQDFANRQPDPANPPPTPDECFEVQNLAGTKFQASWICAPNPAGPSSSILGQPTEAVEVSPGYFVYIFPKDYDLTTDRRVRLFDDHYKKKEWTECNKILFRGLEAELPDPSTLLTKTKPLSTMDTSLPHLTWPDKAAFQAYTDLDDSTTALRASYRPDRTHQTALQSQYGVFAHALKLAFKHQKKIYMSLDPKLKALQDQIYLLSKNKYYHGMAGVCTDWFDQWLLKDHIQIQGPVSTSTNLGVAQHFSHSDSGNDGIIWTFEPLMDEWKDPTSTVYPPIEGVGAHSHEEEVTFYNGKFKVLEMYSQPSLFKVEQEDAIYCRDQIFAVQTAILDGTNKRRSVDNLWHCYMQKYGTEECWKWFDNDLQTEPRYQTIKDALHTEAGALIAYDNPQIPHIQNNILNNDGPMVLYYYLLALLLLLISLCICCLFTSFTGFVCAVFMDKIKSKNKPNIIYNKIPKNELDV